jgi:hypothetical protein
MIIIYQKINNNYLYSHLSVQVDTKKKDILTAFIKQL